MGEAKRSALHGAEHGFSLKHVMAGMNRMNKVTELFGYSTARSSYRFRA